jgi:hypothetical protein
MYDDLVFYDYTFFELTMNAVVINKGNICYKCTTSPSTNLKFFDINKKTQMVRLDLKS